MEDKYGKKKKNISMTAIYCAVNTKRINRKKKNPMIYPNLKFAIRSIPHCNEIPVPVFKGLPELELHSSEGDQAFVLSTDSSEDTVSDVSFLLLYYHSSFLKENLMI